MIYDGNYLVVQESCRKKGIFHGTVYKTFKNVKAYKEWKL